MFRYHMMTCRQAFQQKGGGARGLHCMGTIWFVWEWCCGHHEPASGRLEKVIVVEELLHKFKKKKSSTSNKWLFIVFLSYKTQVLAEGRKLCESQVKSKFCVCSAVSWLVWPVELLESTLWEGHANTTRTKLQEVRWRFPAIMGGRRQKDRSSQQCLPFRAQQLWSGSFWKLNFYNKAASVCLTSALLETLEEMSVPLSGLTEIFLFYDEVGEAQKLILMSLCLCCCRYVWVEPFFTSVSSLRS